MERGSIIQRTGADLVSVFSVRVEGGKPIYDTKPRPTRTLESNLNEFIELMNEWFLIY